MLGFTLKRLVLLIPTFIGVTIFAFAFVRLLPGDPILTLYGERAPSPEIYAELIHRYGYDLPLYQQYFHYLGNLLQGDFGTTFSTKRPVLAEYLSIFPATLELSLCAIVFAMTLGIPAGVIAAVKRGKAIDHVVISSALVGFSMPIFWWGLLLIVVFSGWLHWLPVSGRISVIFYVKPVTGLLLIDSLLSGEKGAFLSAVQHLVLPTIVLGTIPLAVIARQTRSAMLEVLGEDYVRTARAKGLSPFRVVTVHALRNALIPIVTTIGLQVGILLAGALLTETVFSWPGVGRWLVQAINGRDYQAVQGGLVLTALLVMLVNVGVDIAYRLVNPTLRHKG